MDQKKAAKERFDAVRDEVKATLNRAHIARTRYRDQSNKFPQKTQKSTPSSAGAFIDISNEGTSSRGLWEAPHQFGSLFGVSEGHSLYQGTTETVAIAGATQLERSHESCISNGINESVQPYHQPYHKATSYMQDIGASTYQSIPSAPPNLWEMASWPESTKNFGPSSLVDDVCQYPPT